MNRCYTTNLNEEPGIRLFSIRYSIEYLSSKKLDSHSPPAGLRVAQPCRYCFYSVVQKWVLQGPHVAPINVKFQINTRVFQINTVRNDSLSLQRVITHGTAEQPRQLSKFRILAINLPLRGYSFA